MEIYQQRNDHSRKQFTNELLEAARTGNEEALLAALRKKDLDVNCKDTDGRRSTPLHLAAGYNRSRIVEILLRHGANVQAQDKGGLVPLHNACSYGHYDVCETLISAGADVNAKDFWQFTPLHEAAAKVKVEVCSLLLQRGANPYIKDCHGKNAIDVAGSDKLKERITYEYRGYLFLNYIRNGEYSKLKKLLSLSVQNQTCSSLNSTADSSDSLLINSTSPLSHSTYINSIHNCLTDKSSSSTNNCTSSLHHHQFTSDLIYFKNSSNGYGPLHCVADAQPSVSVAKRKQIAEFLIKKKALINEITNEGLTPLVISLDKEHLELAECFLKNKARLDILDNAGFNPLHRMAKKGNYEAVQVREIFEHF